MIESPVPTPAIVVAIRCDRVSIWRLERDGLPLGPTGLWLISPGSPPLTFPATGHRGIIRWVELDGLGWAIEDGELETAANGSLKVALHCAPAAHGTD